LISRTLLVKKAEIRNTKTKQISSSFFLSLLSTFLKRIYILKINYFSKRISTVHKTRCETW